MRKHAATLMLAGHPLRVALVIVAGTHNGDEPTFWLIGTVPLLGTSLLLPRASGLVLSWWVTVAAAAIEVSVNAWLVAAWWRVDTDGAPGEVIVVASTTLTLVAFVGYVSATFIKAGCDRMALLGLMPGIAFIAAGCSSLWRHVANWETVFCIALGSGFLSLVFLVAKLPRGPQTA